jgi:hypothetical protein
MVSGSLSCAYLATFIALLDPFQKTENLRPAFDSAWPAGKKNDPSALVSFRVDPSGERDLPQGKSIIRVEGVSS